MKTLVRILTLFLYLFSIFACLVGCKNINLNDEQVDECDHSFGEWIPHENNHLVQCQERLYQRSCTLCGKFDNKYGSMLDHEFGDAVTVPPATASPPTGWTGCMTSSFWKSPESPVRS